jgi:hypothetical protein
MRIRPLAERLAARGDEVALMLRDLSRAATIFAGLQVRYLQAPFKHNRSADRIDSPSTLAHVLYNTGFANEAELRGLAGAWRSVYELFQPDLIVFDHSPTAMLAARGRRSKLAVIGNGFCCAADLDHMPDWRPWMKKDPQKLHCDEQQVVQNANQVLQSHGQPPLARLAELYTQVEATLLTTFQELDAMPQRPAAEYWGEWTTPFGKPPQWPEGDGKRIFAYVKPFKSLPLVLSELVRRRLPAIVYAGSLDGRLVQQFGAPTLRFESEPVDVSAAAQQCELAILNATHGTTLSMLLHGTPLLMFPLNLEQRITAENVVRLGAGLSFDGATCQEAASPLDALLTIPKFTRAAQKFAQEYAGFDSSKQLERATARLAALLPTGQTIET